MTHTLDKSKVEAELQKRGWKRGQYNDWIIPDSCSFKNIEADWTAAVLSGIVCEHEVRLSENKKHIKKYESKKREHTGG